MSFENNDELFEGIQIMSPSELDQAIGNSSDENKEPENLPTGGEPVVEITPVAAETGAEPVNKEVAESKPNSDSNVSKNEAVYKALMQTLVDEGVITVAEQEKLAEMPGNLDSLKKLLTETIEEGTKAKQEEWKKSLSPEKKRFLEIEDAFDKTDHAIIMAQRLEFFDTIKPESLSGNEQLAKQLYYEQLTAIKNFSHEDALEAIEEAEAAGKLEDKAQKAIPELKQQAHSVVKEAQDAKQAKMAKMAEEQETAFKNLMDNIESRESFIEGLNLNKVSREKLKNNIVSPVYTDPKTGKEYNSLMYKQMKNPTEFEMLINYYDTIGLFNIDRDGKFKPDISKLKTVAKTAAITELDKVISAEDERGVGRNTSVETSEKTKGILDMLEKAYQGK